MIELLGDAGALSVGGVFDAAAGWAGRYGYWAIMLVVAGDGVFPVLPGETAIITGAVLAADGRLELPLIVLFGAIGAVLGDSAAYWIGRAGGPQIRHFVGRFAGAERVEAAERMVRRQGPALVLVGRFLPGLRLAVNISCGAGNMPFPRFLLFDTHRGDPLVHPGLAARLLRRPGVRRPALARPADRARRGRAGGRRHRPARAPAGAAGERGGGERGRGRGRPRGVAGA